MAFRPRVLGDLQRGLHSELFDFVAKLSSRSHFARSLQPLQFFKPTLLSLCLLVVLRAPSAWARGRRWRSARVRPARGAIGSYSAALVCVLVCVCCVVGVCVVTRLIKPAAVVLLAAISPGDGAGGGGFGSAGAGAGGVGGWVQGLCPRTGPGLSFTGAAGAGCQ